ncbi:Imm7 family immunity protein [Streptomyces sp. NPDC020298]|uniref:Imm7 family immunity protein n=1 Tax=unclassified Streptomyces TaxID=2593676 RepID=UPI0033C2C221
MDHGPGERRRRRGPAETDRRRAPGPCGTRRPRVLRLVHIRDDEDPGHGNEVRVLRLVRGAVSEHTEPLLSPCVPTLEDPFGIEES